MPVVTVGSELYQRVEEAAQAQKASVDEILAEAVRLYLWEQDRQKVEQESAAYRRQHAEIKARYLGQFVAVHDGQVVDHGPDFTVLRRRVRQQYGRIPVMITQVAEQSEQPLTRRGFQHENGKR